MRTPGVCRQESRLRRKEREGRRRAMGNAPELRLQDPESLVPERPQGAKGHDPHPLPTAPDLASLPRRERGEVVVVEAGKKMHRRSCVGEVGIGRAQGRAEPPAEPRGPHRLLPGKPGHPVQSMIEPARPNLQSRP